MWGIVLSWVCSRFCELHRDVDMKMMVTYTKAYVLFEIEKFLFAPINRDVVHARYLSFFEDINKYVTVHGEPQFWLVYIRIYTKPPG